MNTIKRIFSNHLEKTISATKELNLKLNEIIKIGDFLKKKIIKKKKNICIWKWRILCGWI